MTLSFPRTICALTALVVTIASAQSLKPDGHWQGVMERDGAVTTVRFDFQTGPGVSPAGLPRKANELWSTHLAGLTIPDQQSSGF